MSRLVVLTLLLTGSIATYAVPSGFMTRLARQGAIVDIVSPIRVFGRELKDPEKFAVHLQKIEKARGRAFTDDEVRERAETQLREFPWGPPLRFTGRMRVLTPTGYRRLNEIQAGDEVYSWNEETGELDLNQVAEVSGSREEVSYGHLSRVAAGRQVIETSDDETNTKTLARAFQRLSGIQVKAGVVNVESCRQAITYALPRFEAEVGLAKVYTLKMRAKPFNFVLEGAVVVR